MRVSCVPSVPSHRSPETTKQSEYSYQAQLQPAMLSKSSRKEKETEMHLPYLYENMFLSETDLFPNNKIWLDDNCAIFFIKLVSLVEEKERKSNTLLKVFLY